MLLFSFSLTLHHISKTDWLGRGLAWKWSETPTLFLSPLVWLKENCAPTTFYGKICLPASKSYNVKHLIQFVTIFASFKNNLPWKLTIFHWLLTFNTNPLSKKKCDHYLTWSSSSRTETFSMKAYMKYGDPHFQCVVFLWFLLMPLIR